MKSTGWADVARWAGALACALLLTSAAASSAQAASFGVESYALTATEENGSADTQAGSHPYELSAEIGCGPMKR